MRLVVSSVCARAEQYGITMNVGYLLVFLFSSFPSCVAQHHRFFSNNQSTRSLKNLNAGSFTETMAATLATPLESRTATSTVTSLPAYTLTCYNPPTISDPWRAMYCASEGGYECDSQGKINKEWKDGVCECICSQGQQAAPWKEG